MFASDEIGFYSLCLLCVGRTTSLFLVNVGVYKAVWFIGTSERSPLFPCISVWDTNSESRIETL